MIEQGDAFTKTTLRLSIGGRESNRSHIQSIWNPGLPERMSQSLGLPTPQGPVGGSGLVPIPQHPCPSLPVC